MAEINQLTRSLQIAEGYALRASEISKEKGKMPYGKVKATEKEKRDAFNKLTPQDVQGLIQKYGFEEVNEWFRKMQGGK